jgi:thiopeptide-type bacteriocin biosynthesis protein
MHELDQHLAMLDQFPIGAGASAVREATGKVKALGLDPGASSVLHVDLFREAPISLGVGVVTELKRSAFLLRDISPPRRDPDLDRFAERFRARFQDAQVPLMLALDEERGVGFGDAVDVDEDRASPLATAQWAGPASPGEWTKRDQTLLALLTEVVANGNRELALSADSLAALQSPQPLPLPDAFVAFATLAAQSATGADGGDFQLVIHGIWGPSGAQLLGRFCHGSRELRDAVASHLREEESRDPDAIYAEVIYQPVPNVGNVVMRPVLRSHEIVLCGTSAAPRDYQIDVADLVVSVRDAGIELWSTRLARRIVPRVSNAYNPGIAALSIYRFFVALQSHGLAGDLGWSWGALHHAPFLPRVTVGRLVLSKARWSLTKQEVATVTSGGTEQQLRAWGRLREERLIPRYVAVGDRATYLTIDTSNALDVACASHILRQQTEAIVLEDLPTRDQLVARGPDEASSYVHELVVPFGRTGTPKTGAIVAGPRQRYVTSPRVDRVEMPGRGRWLYLKLYCAATAADRVLRHAVRPLAAQLEIQGLIRRWFFIRYEDPEFHLRVRLHTTGHNVAAVLATADAVSRELVADGTIWRVQYDTYFREIERYGGSRGFPLCEAWFAEDSVAVLKCLDAYGTSMWPEAVWRLCLYGIDRQLRDAGFSNVQRAAWLQRAYDNQVAADLDSRATTIRVGNVWRRHQDDVIRLLDDGAPHMLDEGRAAIRARSNAGSSLLEQLVELDRADELLVPADDILVSLSHMHCNRFLPRYARAYETTLYGLLRRYYLADRELSRTRTHTVSRPSSAEPGTDGAGGDPSRWRFSDENASHLPGDRTDRT